jgi:RNA polymerase sigma-70 factor, ECF subfamily
MTTAATFDMDTQLMLGAQADDEASFDLLLTRHRTMVVQYLARMIRNHAAAEELAQNVFIRVYRSRHTYAPSARFTTWLFRIATNVALNYFRDERRENRNISLDCEFANGWKRDAADRCATVEERLVRDAAFREVRDAVRSLPAKQRAAVLMHKYEEMDYAQIAAVLGCSQSAVKALMFRAYETLRVRLAHFQGTAAA